jgi:hypothetical protein
MVVAGIVLFAIASAGTFEIVGAILFVAGVRWITIGLVHRHDLAKLPDAEPPAA